MEFVKQQIGLGFTLLWGACLQTDPELRGQLKLGAKEAYEAAHRFLERVGPVADVSVVDGLRELGQAIAEWSVMNRERYEVEAFRWKAADEG